MASPLSAERVGVEAPRAVPESLDRTTASGVLERGVVVCNGKGGVGKSAVAAGLAATAASMGWRTLAVDLDLQGNLGQDLGVVQADRGDCGLALLEAYRDGAPLRVVTGVRDGLDVVPAGAHTDHLAELMRRRVHQEGAAGLTDLRTTIVDAAKGYDLVVFDTPPSSRDLIDAAFCAARFLLIPVRFDRASVDGVERMSDRFKAVRDAGLNPDLELLGAVLFGFGVGERRMIRDTRAELEFELDGLAPVFDRYIRESKKAARHMRDHGVVASEYLTAAQDALPWCESSSGAETFARNAAGLAEDYWEMTREVLQRLTDRLT